MYTRWGDDQVGEAWARLKGLCESVPELSLESKIQLDVRREIHLCCPALMVNLLERLSSIHEGLVELFRRFHPSPIFVISEKWIAIVIIRNGFGLEVLPVRVHTSHVLMMVDPLLKYGRILQLADIYSESCDVFAEYRVL
jgi:hypothetical protein